MQALALTDSSGQGRSAAHVTCIAERGPSRCAEVDVLASQDGDKAPKSMSTYVWTREACWVAAVPYLALDQVPAQDPLE